MKTSKILIYSCLFVLLTAADCQKKTSCSTYVYDEVSNQRISNATITITDGQDENKSTQTNSTGDFSITGKSLNGKQLLISVAKEGYTTESSFPCSSNQAISLKPE